MTTQRELAVSMIDDGTNVREATDAGLVASIRRHGVLQPIVVRRAGRRYQVVMGFRRLAAARRIGLATIPAVIEDAPRDDEILRQVAENTDRRAMNPIDVARALAAYLDAHPGTGKAELAAAMGRPGPTGAVWIANKLALLRLDEETQGRIEAGELPEYLALRQRARLGDGRGQPRVVSLPDEDGRSRSIVVELGDQAGRGTNGLVVIGVDHGIRRVDLVVEDGADRRLALTLSPAEAKLLGRRLTQAYEAIA